MSGEELGEHLDRGVVRALRAGLRITTCPPPRWGDDARASTIDVAYFPYGRRPIRLPVLRRFFDGQALFTLCADETSASVKVSTCPRTVRSRPEQGEPCLTGYQQTSN
ncbi:hypothetical protein [Streptomyces sp. NPDC058572]|uniref:hypothetical protein n=1 Tax=Streptomyces sp. NPDC058572 TaxID=3346546 RepID=UPI003666AF5D